MVYLLRAMGDFLDTLPFLTPEQRAALRLQDLDTSESFAHITVTVLQAEPIGLTLGKASRLLAAARAGTTATPAPPTINVHVAEPPDQSTRIDKALQAAHDDPAKIGALAELGVTTPLVLQADDRIDVAQTKALRQHLLSGAPVGQTWQGQRIVTARELATPPVWRSPRTGKPLQAGKDEVSGTPWGELKLDGLRVAAYGYREDMFEGLGEAAVFAGLTDPHGNLRGRVEARMRATETAPESMDTSIVYRPEMAKTYIRESAPRDLGPLRGGQPPGGSLVSNLTSLLLAMFSGSELRRFLRYRPNGAQIVADLPGENASPAAFAHAAADYLHRQGLIDRALRDALVLERPRRADEIDRVFSAAGI